MGDIALDDIVFDPNCRFDILFQFFSAQIFYEFLLKYKQ